MSKLGQEPVFPCEVHTMDETGRIGGKQTGSYSFMEIGMSKRFYAACAAMQGLLSNADWTKSANIPDDFDEYKTRVVSASYELADELLKQETL